MRYMQRSDRRQNREWVGHTLRRYQHSIGTHKDSIDADGPIPHDHIRWQHCFFLHTVMKYMKIVLRTRTIETIYSRNGRNNSRDL